jgi:hypothetical protein
MLTAQRQAGDLQKVDVSWQDDTGSGSARPVDELMMMVDHDDNFTGPIATSAIRRQGSAVIELPMVSGTIEAIWLFFASEKRKLWSADQYFRI